MSEEIQKEPTIQAPEQQEPIAEAQEELKFINNTEYSLQLFRQFATISSIKGMQGITLAIMFLAFIVFGIVMFCKGDADSGFMMLGLSLLMPISGVFLAFSTANTMQKQMLKANQGKQTRLKIVCADTEIRATNIDCDLVFKYPYKEIKKVQCFGDAIVVITNKGRRIIIQKSGFESETPEAFISYIQTAKTK